MDNVSVELSVVLPVYMVEDYIAQTAQSLLKQTYRNFEIILVDDGTKDNSIEVAEKELKMGDIPFSIIRQQNSGQGYARNAGLKVAKGKWIYFLDADDLVLPSTFERMIAMAKDAGSQLVFSNFKNFVNLGEINDISIDEKKSCSMSAVNLQKAFLKRNMVVLAPGTLYEKKFLIDNNLEFEKMPWSEDLHFVWKVLSVIESASYIDAPFYLYRQRQGSIMHVTSTDRMIESYKSILGLPKFYKNNRLIEKFVVSRWVMGTINATTIIASYDNWLVLWDKLGAKKHFRRLLSFCDTKVRILAFLGLVSKKLYYKTIKRSKEKMV